MDALAGSWIAGAAVGGAVGGLAVLVWALLQKPRACPECGTPVPKIRRPANRRQMMWGGWTCSGCACELDRLGRKIVA